jgi:hypothetical protein
MSDAIKNFIKDKAMGIKLSTIKVLKNEPIMNSMKDSPCGCKHKDDSDDDDTPYYEDEKYIVNEE